MTHRYIVLAAVSSIALSTAAVLAQGQGQGQGQEEQPPLGFFVTSTTHTGNLGGLAGADAECQRLGATVGAGNRTWRAYLSTFATSTESAVNARDRIGDGPWHNANGVLIAANVADLHGDIDRDSNVIHIVTAITEKGEPVIGYDRAEGTPGEHDMLTGSDSHGRASSYTCDNWTSDSADDYAMEGHHDRVGFTDTSWNAAHRSQGCTMEAFIRGGGAGRFYCFAAD